MKPEVKERIYLLVIIFSVFMCSAMVITMLTGAKPENADVHIPVVRELLQSGVSQQDDMQYSGGSIDYQEKNDGDGKVSTDSDIVSVTDGQLGITEEYLSNKLEGILPSGFPLDNTAVNIDENGVSVRGEIERDSIAHYLKKVDKYDKYAVILLLLPETFDIEISFALEQGSPDGKSVAISSDSISISGKTIDPSYIPKEMTDLISKAVNAVIKEYSGLYRFSGLEDGILLMEKI